MSTHTDEPSMPETSPEPLVRKVSRRITAERSTRVLADELAACCLP